MAGANLFQDAVNAIGLGAHTLVAFFFIGLFLFKSSKVMWYQGKRMIAFLAASFNFFIAFSYLLLLLDIGSTVRYDTREVIWTRWLLYGLGAWAYAQLTMIWLTGDADEVDNGLFIGEIFGIPMLSLGMFISLLFASLFSGDSGQWLFIGLALFFLILRFVFIVAEMRTYKKKLRSGAYNWIWLVTQLLIYGAYIVVLILSPVIAEIWVDYTPDNWIYLSLDMLLALLAIIAYFTHKRGSQYKSG